MTSRPHCTAKIEQYFNIVARVNGFTKEKAGQFALCLLEDEHKVEVILKFTPDSGGFQGNLFGTPILLLFVCILLKDNSIDLEKERANRIGIGEIYFRLSRCLYRKYTERKGIQFVKEEFLDVIVRVGKLAWIIMLSKGTCFKKSQVIEIVGSDAFEYGFFIGYEDYRLFGDETADIFIDFPHRSLQEFFGAFYFVWSLHQGRSIEDLVGSDCREPLFMTNPLILEFSVWFIHKKEFFCTSSIDAYHMIKSYISSRINHVQLFLDRIESIYPALKFSDSNRINEMHHDFG